ncbi:MAG: hypothetical protein AAF705_02030 [Bacteroidota bacterium]
MKILLRLFWSFLFLLSSAEMLQAEPLVFDAKYDFHKDASHYIYLSIGAKIALVKKDTDPKKKKENKTPEIQTGKVAAMKAKLGKQNAAGIPIQSGATSSSAAVPKKKSSTLKSGSTSTTELAKQLPAPPKGKVGPRASSAAIPGYESANSRLSGFSSATSSGKQVAPKPVPRPTTAQIQARDAAKRPLPPTTGQSHTGSTSSAPKMTAVKSARLLNTAQAPPKPPKQNKVKLSTTRTAVKKATPINNKTRTSPRKKGKN